jgi:hypothetical protein
MVLLLGVTSAACTVAPNEDPCLREFGDEEPGPELSVRLINTLDAPIYVHAHRVKYIDLEDPTGARPRWQADSWTPSCESFVEDEATCGGCICFDTAVRLEPGGELLQTWSGRVYQELDLDPVCMDTESPLCGDKCSRARTPVAGRWRVLANASLEILCGGTDCPACTDDLGNGACRVTASPVMIEAVDPLPITSAAFDYPSTTEVELRFE